MFIGLCKKTSKWPDTLRELGYDVQFIEREVSIMDSTEKVVPDIVAVSNRYHHAIVADCKGGYSFNDGDQDFRYHKITPSDLYHAGVDVKERRRLTHVACYADDESNHESLAPHTDLPFITFGHDAVRATGDFKNDKTNRKLQEQIPLENTSEPTIFYSFAPDDDDKFVVQHVLNGLFDYISSAKPGQYASIQTDDAAKEILKLTHPYHKVISPRHKRVLAKRIKDVIKHLVRTNVRFREQITRIEGGERGVVTLQSFADTCQKIIDDFQQQDRLVGFSN